MVGRNVWILTALLCLLATPFLLADHQPSLASEPEVGSDTSSAQEDDSSSELQFSVDEVRSEGGSPSSAVSRTSSNSAGDGLVYQQPEISSGGDGLVYHRPQASSPSVNTSTADSAATTANGSTVVQGGLEGGSNYPWGFFKDGDYFKIKADRTGRCLGVAGGSHKDGADVVEWGCYGGDNQRWHLIPIDGHYQIVAKHSGKCLDVRNASLAPDASVIQWPCHGGDNQLWKLKDQQDGTFTVTAKHSGRTLELRGAGGGITPEPPPESGLWRFDKEGVHYRIVSLQTGRCLDVSGAFKENGAAVVQWDCNGGDNQLWDFVHLGEGIYNIKAVHSGMCLDVSEASQADGAAIIQWECNGQGNQRWKLVGGEEAAALVSQHSGKPLRVLGDSPSNGAPAVQWGESTQEQEDDPLPAKTLASSGK